MWAAKIENFAYARAKNLWAGAAPIRTEVYLSANEYPGSFLGWGEDTKIEKTEFVPLAGWPAREAWG